MKEGILYVVIFWAYFLLVCPRIGLFCIGEDDWEPYGSYFACCLLGFLVSMLATLITALVYSFSKCH